MDPIQAFEALISRHGRDHFGKVRLSGFSVHVIGEEDIAFLLSNCGETVGEGDPINEKFMLIKEYLGFEQVDRGEFQLSISKFNPELEIGFLKFVTFRDWIVRVIDESSGQYLLLTTKAHPTGGAWQAYPGSDFFVAWVPKSAVLERL